MESIILKNQVAVPSKYPKLMSIKRGRDLHLVVLMVSNKGGTVVWVTKNETCWFVGDCSECWDSSDLEDFNGELLLKN